MDRCLCCMKEYTVTESKKGRDNTCPFCGASLDIAPKELYHLHPGTVLKGRYELGIAIGFGGFGIIYKAWDSTLETVVAIKEYYPTGLVQRVPGDNQVSIFEKSKKKEFFTGMTRFMSEAKNMARFSDVPNIVHIHSYFEENNTAYIVMEYLDGVTLKSVLEEKGKLSEEETLKFIYPVMDALHALHQEGILHRDVSPDNIFICNSGQIKLIDFGATKFSDEDNEVTRSIVLKPGYAPAEQYRAKSKQGPYTDVYAVGATMYKCITGEAPEESASRVQDDKLKSPAEIDPSVSKYLSQAVMKAMAIESELRFTTISQLKKTLEKKKVVKSAKRDLRARKLRRAFIIVFFLVIIIAGGIGSYQYYQSRSEKIVLDKATITIWIPVQVSDDTREENLATAEQEMMSMSEKFLQEQKNVSIEVTAIPSDEYNDRLEAAAASGDLPTLFISDYASQAVLDKTVAWDDVYEYLDASNCYFLLEYKEKIATGKQFPTGFNAPVVYVRRTNGIDISSVEISQFEQLSADSSKGYYIDSDCYAMAIGSLGGRFYYGDENVLDEKTLDMIRVIDEEFDSKEYSITEDITEQDMAYALFEDGEITYYVASVKEYDSISIEMPGLYSFRPMASEVIYGEFCRMWSIGLGASEDEILAAKVLMNYYLAERPQRTMFMSEKILPLNKTVLSSLADIDDNYSVIREYVDKLCFYYGKQAYIDGKEVSLYEKVILGDEDIENWNKE